MVMNRRSNWEKWVFIWNNVGCPWWRCGAAVSGSAETEPALRWAPSVEWRRGAVETARRAFDSIGRSAAILARP